MRLRGGEAVRLLSGHACVDEHSLRYEYLIQSDGIDYVDALSVFAPFTME